MRSEATPISSDSLARGHEARDPHLRNPLIIAASVMIMLISCLLGTALLVHVLARSHPWQSTRSLGIITAPDLKPLTRFPSPALEIDDGHADFVALYQNQSNRLAGYAWLDHSQGIVRIPIERAMALLADRGLPVRTNTAASARPLSLQLLPERPNDR